MISKPMVMKSQLTFSDLHSRYGLTQILKLHFTGGSEKLETVETSREKLNWYHLKRTSVNEGVLDVPKEFLTSKL